MENVILSYFTIPKSYFINYTIQFYNTPSIPKLYYFTILLKYYFFNLSLLFLFNVISFSNSTVPSFSNSTIPTVNFQQPASFFFFPTISTTWVYFCFQFLSNYFNNLPIFFFFLERTCQISMYSNQPTLKIHIHIYSIKPAKYQCKIHIHIYRCILLNINVFNLSILMIHIHTYIQNLSIFLFFLRKNLSNINLLKLINFKNPHTYVYIQPAKYQCT